MVGDESESTFCYVCRSHVHRLDPRVMRDRPRSWLVLFLHLEQCCCCCCCCCPSHRLLRHLTLQHDITSPVVEQCDLANGHNACSGSAHEALTFSLGLDQWMIYTATIIDPLVLYGHVSHVPSHSHDSISTTTTANLVIVRSML